MNTNAHNLNAAGNVILAGIFAANYGWWAAIPLALVIFWRGE